MAATEITLGYCAEYDAGEKNEVSSFEPLLPAAATRITPLEAAYWIASSIVGLSPPPPQLALTTLAPWSTAKWIALAPSASSPEPAESRNFRFMICTVQAAPATPRALLPTAPMMPAVCVPWP